MIAAIFSGFLLAIIAPWITRVLRGGAGWTLAMLPGALTIYFATNLPLIARGDTLRVDAAWVPSLGIALSFVLDGFSLLFALLISGFGALVFVYAGAYMGAHPLRGRLFAALSAFMAAMLGVVLADNVVTLFVFWELTSLTSYILIGFEQERPAARAAALQALLVTGVGGLALLSGLLLLGQIGGTYELSALLSQRERVQADALYPVVLLLVVAGAFTKSAQFPFHFWLPNAMEAPTPVSAYLHSSTMVKAGVYLLGRMAPVLGGTVLWQLLLVPVGGVTMVLGAVLAYRNTDLKRILAYSTIAVLGTLVLLLGLGTELAIGAAVVYLVAHAFYKGALFLVAGTIAHETGERNVTRLGGLMRAMPLTAVAAMAAALSMAGLPPLLGFIGKELLLDATLHSSFLAGVTTAATAGSAGLLVAVALVVGFGSFVGVRPRVLAAVHEGPPGLWIGAVILASGGIILGVAAQPFAGVLLQAAATSIYGAPVTLGLSLWHGPTPQLALSGLALAAGVVLYTQRAHVQRVIAFRAPAGLTADGWYHGLLRGLNWVASTQTRLLQSGYLRLYVAIIVSTTVAVTGYALVSRGSLELRGAGFDATSVEIILAILVLIASAAVARSQSRLGAVAMLGVVGYGVALIFAVNGAPDLAMTQFIIETLMVVLFVLVVYHLPSIRIRSSAGVRMRDLIVAGTAGVLMTALVILATQRQLHTTIATFYGDHSLTEAHGRNVVNVILVDFRALDTLGEIAVLALAGIGVHALLKLRRGGTPDA